MSRTDRLEQDAEGLLFDTLAELDAGMLGIEGSGQHMQPMSHYVDRDAATLWFITFRESDLVRSVGTGAMAKFTITGSDQDVWACMQGTLEQSSDEGKLDEYWSAVPAAWFEHGREDPSITLLRMPLRSAAIWTSTSSSLVFGMEIARSNLSETHKPHIGGHKVIEFGAV